VPGSQMPREKAVRGKCVRGSSECARAEGTGAGNAGSSGRARGNASSHAQECAVLALSVQRRGVAVEGNQKIMLPVPEMVTASNNESNA